MNEMSYSKASDPPSSRKKALGKTFRPGDKLAGRFEVIRPLRKGGNGDVYLVKHAEFPDRLLAMKTLKPTPEDDFEVAVARFRNEVIAAYSVTHPNVVRIFDYIREGELIAFTMEYIVGGDLADILSNHRRLTMHQVLHLFSQICDGVNAIHDAHIIHRDLKPENILITKDGKVKISDFGTARRGETLSKKGGITGTIAYLSPEYLRDGQLDQRSDIYALGILAYEMVTSETPFKGDTLIETLSLRLHETPPAPQELNPLCPLSLGNLILKCLKANPEERYQSISEIQRDLKKVSLSRVTPSRSTAGTAVPVPDAALGTVSVRVQQPPPPSVDTSQSVVRGMVPTTRQPVIQAEPEVKQLKREPIAAPLVARPTPKVRRRKRRSTAATAFMIFICFAIGAGAAAFVAKKLNEKHAANGNPDVADAPRVGDMPASESESERLRQEANAQLSKLAQVVKSPESQAVHQIPAPVVAVEEDIPFAPEPELPRAPVVPEAKKPLSSAPGETKAQTAPQPVHEALVPDETSPFDEKTEIPEPGGVLTAPLMPELSLGEKKPPADALTANGAKPAANAVAAGNGSNVLVSATEPAGWYVLFEETAEQSEGATMVEMLTSSGMEAMLQTQSGPGQPAYRVLLGPFSSEIEAKARKDQLHLPPERAASPLIKIVNG